MPKFDAFILGSQLVPCRETDRARWDRLPRGKELQVTIKAERSGPQHRMSRKLIASVAEAYRDGPDGLIDVNDEIVLTDLMCGTGYAQTRLMSPFERQIYHGDAASKIAFRPSTKFDSMDRDEYGRFIDRARDFLMHFHSDWLPESLPGREALQILDKMGAKPGGGIYVPESAK